MLLPSQAESRTGRSPRMTLRLQMAACVSPMFKMRFLVCASGEMILGQV